jgi:MFS transporter, DHA1 family, inner membrane transport protein
MSVTSAGQSPLISKVPRHILPVIVLAQLFGTSLWFAGNAVLPDLQRAWQLQAQFGDVLGPLTISVQLGFVLGTVLMAWLGVADRYSPRKVFVLCALLGALTNLVPWFVQSLSSAADVRYGSLLLSRFIVGFLLAGVYPVGMRIASGWYQKGLGAALGWMVGALILGTGLPFGLRAIGAQWAWQDVVIVVSAIATLGGVLMGLLVPDGPYWVRAVKARSQTAGSWQVIVSNPNLRASVFGYFGHMWELYSFFALVPIIISHYLHTSITPGIAGFVFVAIAAGAMFAAAGGHIALKVGGARVATVLLATSGLCCLLMPLMMQAPWWLFLLWMLVWGATVSSDSPQFSALTARNAPADQVGGVLLTTNAIGFSICIVSILVSTSLWPVIGLQWIGWLWLPGPVLGVLAMRRLWRAA